MNIIHMHIIILYKIQIFVFQILAFNIDKHAWRLLAVYDLEVGCLTFDTVFEMYSGYYYIR